MSLSTDQFLGLKFPAMPAHLGKGAPVYFETIMGSGERITVLLVFIAEDGRAFVEYTIRPERMIGVFGALASKVQGMIDWVAESVSEYCAESEDSLPFCQWPFTGVEMGRVCDIAYDDPADAIRQLKMMNSAFSCLGCRMPVGGPLVACAEHGGES